MRLLKNSFLVAMVISLAACAPEPVANFTYSYTDNRAPAEVTFTNTSTDADSYRWDFGDGAASSEKHPVHIFETPGTFNITLLAKGSGGDNSITKSIVIEQATSYIIRNQLSVSLYNVVSFYWDGANFLEEVEHGTLTPGSESQEVYTSYTEIDLYVEDEYGTAYFSSYPWLLTTNSRNYINITADSYFTEVTASIKGTEGFSPADLQQIREKGSARMLSEIER